VQHTGENAGALVPTLAEPMAAAADVETRTVGSAAVMLTEEDKHHFLDRARQWKRGTTLV